MIILKYTGIDTDEIQVRIIEELGPFAIILFTRTAPTSFLSRLLTGERVEVTVGIEEEDYIQHKKGNKYPLEMPTRHFLLELDREELPLIVSGPILFQKDAKNVIFLIGTDDVNKVATSIKLALKWQGDSGEKVSIINLGTPSAEEKSQMESLSSIFQLHYSAIGDERSLNDSIEKSSSSIFLVLISESFATPSLSQLLTRWPVHSLMLILDATYPIRKQVIEIEKYEGFNLFGLIYVELEENPSLLFVEELFQKKKTPISYFVEGSDAKVANVEDIHIRITNEKLAGK